VLRRVQNSADEDQQEEVVTYFKLQEMYLSGYSQNTKQVRYKIHQEV
jgi:hypothetical protein